MGAKAQLDLIATFTEDIGIELGNDKCAYIYIERGKRNTLGEKFGINDIELSEVECGINDMELNEVECGKSK